MADFINAHDLLAYNVGQAVEDTVAVRTEVGNMTQRVDPLNLMDTLALPVMPAPVPVEPEPTVEDVYRSHATAGANLHGSIRAEISMLDMGVTQNIAEFADRIHHYLAEYEITIGSVRNNYLPPF